MEISEMLLRLILLNKILILGNRIGYNKMKRGWKGDGV